MNEISERYRRHADDFEQKVADVAPRQWDHPSPCEGWTALDVVRHIVDMHGAMLRPLGRGLSPAPQVGEDPLAAFRSARRDVEAVLGDPELAETECDTPAGRMTVARQIDQVVSDDLVIHGWDLARATGQDDTIDIRDVQSMWSAVTMMPAETLDRMRTPEAFGPGIYVYGAEIPVAPHSPPQDRLLGVLGRDPAWAPPVRR